MATPIFCCGFECGVDSHSIASAYDTSIVRSGARSARLQLAASTGVVKAEPSLLTLGGTLYVIKGYVRFTTLPTTNFPILTAQTNVAPTTSVIGAVFQSSDGKIYPGRHALDSTLTLGASGFAITTDRWYLIDVRINIVANPWLIDVSVDGISLTQASIAVAAGTTTVIGFGRRNSGAGTPSTTTDMYCDDFVISATTGDYPLGNGYIHPFILTADGTHNIAGTGDFQRGNTGVDILNATTTAFQLVDDVPLPSGAVDQADCWRGVAPANPTTDYVEGLFGPASGIPTPGKGPRAVEVILAHHQISTTVGQMSVQLNDNGTVNDIFNTGAAAGVTTYRYATKQYATGPAGAWTVVSGAGNFNNVRCRFLAQDANPDQCLDAIMIEAEFAEPQQKIVQVKQAVNRSNTY